MSTCVAKNNDANKLHSTPVQLHSLEINYCKQVLQLKYRIKNIVTGQFLAKFIASPTLISYLKSINNAGIIKYHIPSIYQPYSSKKWKDDGQRKPPPSHNRYAPKPNSQLVFCHIPGYKGELRDVKNVPFTRKMKNTRYIKKIFLHF